MSAHYVDLLMQEWGINKQPCELRASVRRMLEELSAEACLILRSPRLQVAVLQKPGNFGTVWAYFPMHRRRTIAREVCLNPSARVLLAFSAPVIKKNAESAVFELALRHHLGHALLYLRSPKARNKCADAMKEWEDCFVGRWRMKARRKQPAKGD